MKYTNWEMDARIPLIVHDPQASHTWGERTASLVEHVDLYPTLAEMAGVPVDASVESIEGSSYVAVGGWYCGGRASANFDAHNLIVSLVGWLVGWLVG